MQLPEELGINLSQVVTDNNVRQRKQGLGADIGSIIWSWDSWITMETRRQTVRVMILRYVYGKS